MTRFTLLTIAALAISGCDRQSPAITPTTPTAGSTTMAVSASPPAAIKPAQYVGSEQCQLCHISQQQDWLHSDHHQAMMVMNDNNVLGNFNNTTLKHHYQQTTFRRDDNNYQIKTDQQSSSPVTLNLKYTFGVFPLQQYLTDLPDGHLQALPFAWDSRTAKNGGQHWFHLYSAEKIVPGDVLHWNSPSHNANHMCIECHTTNFTKNHNSSNNSFQSSWKEIGVGCESCHGPGSQHIEWARSPDKNTNDKKGWGIGLTSGAINLWRHQTETTAPQRTQKADSTQVEQCAQCHSRRSRIHASNHEPSLLDAFFPSLLDEGLYHPDGQIQDEVYEYGSFLQSRMAEKGVTCSNCHNPHSGKPVIEGNGLCLQCHVSTYGTEKHTLHKNDSPGNLCVECHMPSTTYMQVDARRDHSLRTPRPDLSEKLGTPNACNQCHINQSAAWASAILDKKIGKEWRKPHYGEVFAEARLAQPVIYEKLVALIEDVNQPAIVRATAISLLPNFISRDYQPIITKMATDKEPLIRAGVLRAAESLSPQALQLIAPLLQDSHRVIRIETARLLAGTPASHNNNAFDKAKQEYIDSQQLNADRAASLANLATFAIKEGRLADAEKHLLDALRKEPYYIPAAVNLADLYRMTQRHTESGQILQNAIARIDDNAELHLAYALWLVRDQQLDVASKHIQRAVELGQDPHFRFVHALALQQQDKIPMALAELDKAAAMPRYNRNVQIARIELAWQAGMKERVINYLELWQKLDPEDPAIREWQSRTRQ